VSLYRRGSIWWAKWQIGGRRIAESTGTADRAQAQEWHDRRRAALWDEIRLGKKPARTWDDAALDWWQSHGQHKRSAEDDRLRLVKLTAKLTGKALDGITSESVAKATPARGRDRRVGGKLKHGKPLSPATRNRYAALASAILHHAASKGWIAKAPVFRYAEEGTGRFDFLTREEARVVGKQLGMASLKRPLAENTMRRIATTVAATAIAAAAFVVTAAPALAEVIWDL